MRTTRLATPLVALLGLVLAACSSAAATSAPATAAPATAAPATAAAPTAAAPTAAPSAAGLINVNYALPVSTTTLDTVGVYFAIDKGFFAQQGLQVSVQGYGRATSIRAMLSGDADIIEIDSGSALLAYNSGAPLHFVSMPVPGALDVIIAKPDITSVEGAVGKNWATSGAGSQGQVFAETLLKKHNVDLSSVTFVPVGSSADRGKALLAGTVDITTMTIATTPAMLDAVNAKQLSVIGSISTEIPDYVNVFDAVSDPFLKDHPDVIQKFVTAELQGYRWAAQNIDEAAAIATAHIPETSLDLVKAGIQRMVSEKIWNYNSFTVDKVQQAITFLENNGLIPKGIKATDVTAIQFTDKAVQDLGPFTSP